MTHADRVRSPELAESFDVEAVRRDFPALHQDARGKRLAYLDNGATSHKPQVVLDAVQRSLSLDNSNVHRGVHALSERATQQYDAARETMARFINAPSADEIIFTRGTTEAINLVAQTLGRQRVAEGDTVVITEMEHHSNIVPWQMLCDQQGAALRAVRVTDEGELDLDHLETLLDEGPRLLSLTHVSNVLGTINPIEEVCRMARARDVPVLVDGAQAAPHVAIDVVALGCDLYALSGHKMYGPNGIGILWGRGELLESMPAWQGGGDMIRSVSLERSTYAPPPAKFEAGTPHISGAIGLAAAANYLTGLGLDRVARHEGALTSYAEERLSSVDGVRLLGRAAERTSVLSFLVDGVHAHDVGTILDSEGIAVRAGHHCAQPLMQRFGVAATVRASLGVYNTREEIDRLVAGVERALEVFA